MKRGHKMPPLMLTNEEVLGLALGLQDARGLCLAGASGVVVGGETGDAHRLAPGEEAT